MGTHQLSDLFDEIDALINAHEIDQAKYLLARLEVKSLPEKSRGKFASLARRSGMWKLALRILQANVFGVGAPDPDDLIEYASSLRRLGLINQALILLNRTPESAKKHLNKAFCYVHLWDYPAAQVELEYYLKHENLNLKDQLVGKVNLLACYIENQEFDRALQFLNQFEDECAVHSPHLLLNCQETRGQILIKTGQADEAIRVLEEAQRKTKQQQHHTSLFIEKWLLIAYFMKGRLKSDAPEVVRFKQSVRNAGFWEVLRDFDWQLAKIFNDQNLMRSIYFGTPFQGFRKIMVAEVGADLFKNSFLQSHGRIGEKTAEPFDAFAFDHVPLAYGKAVHRLLMLLLSDQYSPFSVVRIFNSLFSDELFDPATGPKKVYRSLEQLKEAIIEHKLPLSLQSTSKGYRLRATENSSLWVHEKMVFTSREEFLSHILYLSGLRQNFRVKEARQVIPLSTHQWYRAFKSMQEQGVLEPSSDSENFYSLKIS